jgi:thiamine-phosphate pyrophosphorylase
VGSELAGARRLRGLYAVTPENPDTRALAAGVEACLAGGATLVQYRAKKASADLALEQARLLAGICRDAGVPLIVNDSLELALAAGADGVHLGRDDIDPRHARRLFPRGIIGVSCYADPEGARAAALARADYVAIGSVFPSSTKPGAVRAPLEMLAAAKRASALPVVAIGGITSANAAQAIAAGADMVAVISALFGAPDVKAAARELARLFASSPAGSEHVRAQPRAL